MSSSGNSEQSSEETEHRSFLWKARGGPMSSVATAQSLTRELADMLAPRDGWKAQVSAVHRRLTDKKFAFADPNLSWNRVKSWLYAEARRVDYHHVRALEELRALEEARRERLKLAATANRLAALLAAEGAPLDGRQMRALGRLAGTLDSAGIGAADGGAAR
jgi:hypothetical protein